MPSLPYIEDLLFSLKCTLPSSIFSASIAIADLQYLVGAWTYLIFDRFIQMSGMTVGSMIHADRRIREYEAKIRLEKRLQHERALWDTYHDENNKVNSPSPVRDALVKEGK
jgi:hypothetical protein